MSGYLLILVIVSATAAHAFTTFQNVSGLLSYVNQIRANHAAGPVSYSAALETGAQAWAAHLAALNSLIHSDSSNGENLAEMYTSVSSWKTAIDLWYAENTGYNYASNAFDPARGHFTQVKTNSKSKLSFFCMGCGTRWAEYGNLKCCNLNMFLIYML